MSIIKKVALTLIIIGAINSGLIGFFSFDLIADFLGGKDAIFPRFIYSMIGLAGLLSFAIYTDLLHTERNSSEEYFNYSMEFGEEMDFTDLDQHHFKDDRLR